MRRAGKPCVRPHPNGLSHTNEVKLRLSIGIFVGAGGPGGVDLLSIRGDQFFGAIHGQNLVGGLVNLSHGDIPDGLSENKSMMVPDGSKAVGIGAVHNDDNRCARRRCDVNRSGVVGDKYSQPRLRRDELRDGETVEEDRPLGKLRTHLRYL